MRISSWLARVAGTLWDIDTYGMVFTFTTA